MVGKPRSHCRPRWSAISGDPPARRSSPGFVQSLSGAGGADLIGFGDAGVWTAMGDGLGGVAPNRFVRASFGYLNTVLALTPVDLAAGSQGIWRSTDRGGS